MTLFPNHCSQWCLHKSCVSALHCKLVTPCLIVKLGGIFVSHDLFGSYILLYVGYLIELAVDISANLL